MKVGEVYNQRWVACLLACLLPFSFKASNFLISPEPNIIPFRHYFVSQPVQICCH